MVALPNGAVVRRGRVAHRRRSAPALERRERVGQHQHHGRLRRVVGRLADRDDRPLQCGLLDPQATVLDRAPHGPDRRPARPADRPARRPGRGRSAWPARAAPAGSSSLHRRRQRRPRTVMAGASSSPRTTTRAAPAAPESRRAGPRPGRRPAQPPRRRQASASSAAPAASSSAAACRLAVGELGEEGDVVAHVVSRLDQLPGGQPVGDPGRRLVGTHVLDPLGGRLGLRRCAPRPPGSAPHRAARRRRGPGRPATTSRASCAWRP